MAAQKIEMPVQEIADLCRRYQVRELAVFDSFLRDDFRPAFCIARSTWYPRPD